MNINLISQNLYSDKSNITNSPAYSSAVPFKGHFGDEFIKKGNLWLRHETAFFRDSKSNEFITKYILDNLQNKKEINIISGACSTGEEALT